ncbi:acyl-CoA thioesterase [Schlegelella sp. S2-27]|uniref:Acyl-CoA thioesterase n=1 Tax=Caldimonas mangrovi TaxID=2944811 RepID=A0ABT0YVL3_9BURK|nr:thioesterase family protein [Caldimonas mangrovi]MCM5682792.1 acyl-CoA thioesterase [Caldimonas mangrovi]
MSRATTFAVQVQFGDCDPAGIVFFPNFSRWMDAASLHFFVQCGVPPWRELVKTTGIIGTPLLEIHTRFLQPATYGETLEVHTDIEEWRRKVFIQRHRVMRNETLLCEGRETRAFCIRDAEGRLRSIPVPDDIRTLCA